MDGFHRRQEYLLSHTLIRDGREIPMVDVKGTPETFDLEKLEEAIKELASGKICGWPVYDRLLHDPVPAVFLCRLHYTGPGRRIHAERAPRIKAYRKRSRFRDCRRIR